MADVLTQKGQFVEIDFTAKIKQSGEIFDTTIKEEAKKANLPSERVRPIVVCIGEGMLLKGFDKALEGKEIGKEYSVEVPSKEAFGERLASMIKIIPLKIFQQKGIMPYAGLSLNMDGVVVRISAVSGGRVIADFNHPLSGKDLVYMFKIRKIVMDDKEKLSSLVETFLREDPSKAIKSLDGKKAVIKSANKLPKNFIDDISGRILKLTGISAMIESA